MKMKEYNAFIITHFNIDILSMFAAHANYLYFPGTQPPQVHLKKYPLFSSSSSPAFCIVNILFSYTFFGKTKLLLLILNNYSERLGAGEEKRLNEVVFRREEEEEIEKTKM